jgi:hypothetical protein
MKLLSLWLLGAALALAQTCQTTDIPLSGSYDGELAETDCTVRDYIRAETSNLKADALRVTLRDRSVLRVRMNSTQIDPFLYLLNQAGTVMARNDNSGGGRNSDLSIQLAPGTYTIIAASAATGLGSYQLTTAARSPRVCAPQDLSLTGDTVEGDLAETDCAGVDLALNATDTNAVDVYRFEVSRNSVLSLEMTSTTLAPVLGVYTARGSRVGGTNATATTARLTIGLPPGSYTVRAGTSRAVTGAYRLRALRENARVCDPPTLVPGERTAGEFTPSDCRLVDILPFSTWQGPVDQYRIELTERSVVKIGMQSTLLDSYLAVLDQNGFALADNDDANRNTVDSEVYMSLAPGRYTVVAAELYGDIGRYTITFDVEKPRTCAAVSLNAPGSAAVALTRDGCRVMDLMSPSDSTAPAAAASVKVTERVWTSVAATATGMTPLLMLTQEDGVRIGIDDFVTQRSALLLPGTYHLLLTTREGVAGEATVNVATRAPAVCAPAPLPWNEFQSGELTASDCVEAEILPFFTNTSVRSDLWKLEAASEPRWRPPTRCPTCSSSMQT